MRIYYNVRLFPDSIDAIDENIPKVSIYWSRLESLDEARAMRGEGYCLQSSSSTAIVTIVDSGVERICDSGAWLFHPLSKNEDSIALMAVQKAGEKSKQIWNKLFDVLYKTCGEPVTHNCRLFETTKSLGEIDRAIEESLGVDIKYIFWEHLDDCYNVRVAGCGLNKLFVRQLYEPVEVMCAQDAQGVVTTGYVGVDLGIEKDYTTIIEQKIKEIKDNKMTFKERVKGDLEKVAYRQGARKAMNVTHAMILYGAQTHCNFDGPKLSVLLDILESDFGKAMMSWGLGEGLGRVGQDNDILNKLAEEFRVSGLDLGAEAGLEKVLGLSGDMMPMIMSLANAIKVSSEGGVTEAMAAWKAVDDSMPQKVRVAVGEMSRIRADVVNEPANDETTEDQQLVQFLPKQYASCI